MNEDLSLIVSLDIEKSASNIRSQLNQLENQLKNDKIKISAEIDSEDLTKKLVKELEERCTKSILLNNSFLEEKDLETKIMESQYGRLLSVLKHKYEKAVKKVAKKSLLLYTLKWKICSAYAWRDRNVLQ